jgi:hypothetical protein
MYVVTANQLPELLSKSTLLRNKKLNLANPYDFISGEDMGFHIFQSYNRTIALTKYLTLSQYHTIPIPHPPSLGKWPLPLRGKWESRYSDKRKNYLRNPNR